MGPSISDQAPTAIVDGGQYRYGRFGTLFENTGLVDVHRPYHYPLPRILKRSRLKEWQTFVCVDVRWFVFCTIFNAKLMTLFDFFAYDRTRGRKYTLRKLVPGSAVRFPDTLTSFSAGSDGKQEWLRISGHLPSGGKKAGGVEIEVRQRPVPGRGGFSGQFSLRYMPGFDQPDVVCHPMGLNRALYSAKLVSRVSGTFVSEGDSYEFGGSGPAIGIFEDHKGYYPWRMRRDAVKGFGVDSVGRITGFTLGESQVRDRDRNNENCLWIDGVRWTLPSVRVTRPNGIGNEWIIQDTEGLVDLVFVPETPNALRVRFGFIETDFDAPAGTFKGEIRNGSGDRIDASSLYGMGAKLYLRA